MTQLDHEGAGPAPRAAASTPPPVPAGSEPSPDDPDGYRADQIKVLEGLEAVRKRPAMYIGSTGAQGLHHLVYEVVDNSIDEALAGYCDTVRVTLHIDNSVTIADNGRGIPVDQHASGRSAAEVVLTVLHAGGKFDNESYKVSGGLHGVGVSVVNALSESLDLEIWRDGQVYRQQYERGRPLAGLEVIGRTKRRGTKITFKADTQVFETVEFSFDTLAHRLRELAFLNAGVLITLIDERSDKSHEFSYEGGIRSFVEFINRNKAVTNSEPIYMQGARDGVDAEIALQWNDGYADTVYAFANNINTQEGGTHLSGFRAALTSTINNYANRNNLARDLKESIGGDDIREGLVAVVSVKIPQPQFEGQTKTKLGNTEVKGIVQAIVNDHLGAYLEENPAVAKRIVNKAIDAARCPRGGAQGAGSGAPQGSPGQQRAARQAGRLPGTRSGAQRDLHRRGRVGRRLGQAGARSAVPGDPPHQGQDPQRGEGPVRQDAGQRRDQDDDRGPRVRDRQGGLRSLQAAVPPHRDHDRRRRGRIAYPHAAADVLLPPDAGADRARPRIHRAASSVPREAGPRGELHQG